MTPVPARVLLDRLGRSLLPTYGARANAADSLVALQRTRLARAEAQDALRGAETGQQPSGAGPGRAER